MSSITDGIKKAVNAVGDGIKKSGQGIKDFCKDVISKYQFRLSPRPRVSLTDRK